MAFTYVPGTLLGNVRMLVPDRVSGAGNYFFEDDEITAMLALEGNNVKRTAALCLETMAADEAYVQKAIRILDLTTNGPAVAASLLQRAKALREQADREEMADEGGAFDVAEMVVDTFSYRKRLRNEMLRDA
jgi:Arc/MetJ family transcription regulator